MYETLLRFLAIRRVSGRSSAAPVDLLDPDQRAKLRRMLGSQDWEVLEQKYQELWVSAVNRLISETNPERLESRQTEVQTIEKMLSLPHRLLENTNQEHN